MFTLENCYLSVVFLFVALALGCESESYSIFCIWHGCWNKLVVSYFCEKVTILHAIRNILHSENKVCQLLNDGFKSSMKYVTVQRIQMQLRPISEFTHDGEPSDQTSHSFVESMEYEGEFIITNFANSSFIIVRSVYSAYFLLLLQYSHLLQILI